jgi:hypothetical protein
LTKKGLRRRWVSARLKNNAAPAYLLEFVRLLSDNSVLVTEKKKGKRTSGLQLLSSVDCQMCEVKAAEAKVIAESVKTLRSFAL